MARRTVITADIIRRAARLAARYQTVDERQAFVLGYLLGPLDGYEDLVKAIETGEAPAPDFDEFLGDVVSDSINAA